MRVKRLSVARALEEFPEGEFVFCGLSQPVEELKPLPIRTKFRSGPYENPLTGPHLYADDNSSDLRAAIRAARKENRLARKDRINLQEAIALERLTRTKISPRPLVYTSGVFMYALAYGAVPRTNERGEMLYTWSAGARYDYRNQQACMSFSLSEEYRQQLRQREAIDDREAYVHVLPAARVKPFITAGEFVSDRPEKPTAIVTARLGDLTPHWTLLPPKRRFGHGASERPTDHSACCWHFPQPEAGYLAAREAWTSFGESMLAAPRTSMQRRTKQLRRERRAERIST